LTWEHDAAYEVALRAAVHGAGGVGGAKRSDPIGGAANGMPRN
jgi:hypothetical protein